MMRIKVQVVIEDAAGPAVTHEVACLERGELIPETLGLTLVEAKTVLAGVQATLTAAQAATYLDQAASCADCGATLARKGQHTVVMRSLFGKLRLPSPRFYRCACQAAEERSFSPLAQLLPQRTLPELLYLEGKWAALMSYGLSTKLLGEVLPMEEQANPATVYRHVQQMAERLEQELGDEQGAFITGCPREWEALPEPPPPLVVGIDGGYVHAREKDCRQAGSFEVIVGKSMSGEDSSRCLGFVNGYDTKPKRRLFEVLNAQGMQMNQLVTFLSDGGDTVRELQLYLNPQAEHILDWFHVAMRVTVLRHLALGLPGNPAVSGAGKKKPTPPPEDDETPPDGEEITEQLERVKWFVWHGNVFEALEALDSLEDDVALLAGDSEAGAKLAKTLGEFTGYIRANRAYIVNYGDRYRNGEAISSAFVESTVNQVVSRRMVKKQQMRWTKPGAPRLLQVRTQVLDGELAKTFGRWYPQLQLTEQEVPLAA
jgi:hypothetical protein